MKISHIRIENFRTFVDFSQDVGRSNLLVGKNNTGKSNLLWAIYCFYYPNNLSQDDIRKDSDGNRVADEFKIELTFDELNAEEQRENDKYYHNGKLKIQLRGWIDEDSGFKSEHHGYILSEKLIFPTDFDDSLKELLQSPSSPKKTVLSNFPELNEITLEIQPKGQITKENWGIIKSEFVKRHTEIQREPQEILAEEKYHGFVRTREVNRTGDCIFIPAKRDPSEVLKTEGTKSPIRQLVEILVGDITSEEIKDDFQKVREKVTQERAEKIKILENKFKEELTLWKTEVNINLKTFEISDVLPLAFDVLYHDGVPTDLERKGTGLQRYIFFKFLKISNEMRLGENKSLILLFEEPEAHLHPQIQREIATILRSMPTYSNMQYQIFITTHSPQFIDMQNLDEVFVMNKADDGCTESSRCSLTLTNIKEYIKTILFFDAKVSEIFFADRIILIEGQSEEVTFNFFIQKGEIDVTNVSIINAKSKNNIPTFLNVFHELGIPYSVMVDEDPYFLPNFQKTNPNAIKEKKKQYKFTNKIADQINDSIGDLFVISPDFDTFLGISQSQINNLGKPTAVFNKLTEYSEKNDKKLEEVKDLLKLLLNPENLHHKIVIQDGTEWKWLEESSVQIPKANFQDLKTAIQQVIKTYKDVVNRISDQNQQEIKLLFNNSQKSVPKKKKKLKRSPQKPKKEVKLDKWISYKKKADYS